LTEFKERYEVDGQTFQYQRTLRGYELSLILPDGVERMVATFPAIFINPDGSAWTIVRYLQGSSSPGRERIVRREEAEKIAAGEKVSLTPIPEILGNETLALLLDAPVDGTRIIIQPLTDGMWLVMRRYPPGYFRHLVLADADRVLDEWAKMPEGDDETHRRPRSIGNQQF